LLLEGRYRMGFRPDQVNPGLVKRAVLWKASGMSTLAEIEAAVPNLSPAELAEHPDHGAVRLRLEEFTEAGDRFGLA